MKRPIIISAGLILLAALLAVGWLLFTDGGLRFAFSRLASTLPMEVSAEEVSGQIAGTISLTGLQVRDRDFSVQAARTDVELSVLRLFAGTVELRTVTVEGVQIAQGAAPSEAAGTEPVPVTLPEPNLPVALAVGDFRGRDISLLRAGQPPLVLIALGITDLSYAEGQWTVARLSVDSQQLSGEGDFSYLARGRHDMRFHFKGISQLYDNTIQVDTLVEGNDGGLSVTQDVAGAVAGHLEGRLEDLRAVPRWTVKGTLETADPSQLHPAWPSGEFRIALDAQGQGGEALATGSLTLSGQPSLDYIVELGAEAGGLVLRRLELKETDGLASVAFAGQLIPSSPYPDVQGQLVWQSVAWPLARVAGEPPALSSPAGSIELKGSAGSYELHGQVTIGNGTTEGTLSTAGILDLRNEEPQFGLEGAWDALTVRTSQRAFLVRDGQYSLSGQASAYRFSSAFELVADDWPALKISAAGQGDRAALNFEMLEASSAAGRISGRGSVGLSEGTPFDLLVQGTAINPGAFVSSWNGRMDLDATLKGSIAAEGLDLKLGLQRLRGELRGQPVTASAGLAYAKKNVRVTRLDARWADAEVFADGSLGARMDFSWRVAIPDVAKLTDQGGGRFNSSGKISGTRLQPLLVAQLEGQDLVIDAYAAKQLRAVANIDFATGNSSLVEATASGVTVPGNALSKIELRGGGEASGHRVSLRIESTKGAISTELSGSLNKNRWLGNVAATQLDVDSGTWVQEAASALNISETDWSLAKSCLRREAAEVCVSAVGASNGPSEFELFVQSLPLAELGLLLPEGLEYAGTMSGHGKLDGFGKAPIANASFEVSGGKAWQVIDDEQLELLDFRSLNGGARLANQRLTLNAVLREPGNPEVTLEANLPFEDWGLARGAVEGRLEGTLSSLGFLSILFPDLAEIEGRVETRLRLSGTTEAPTWDGHAELIDGQATVPGLGIKLSRLSARADANGNKLRLRGQVFSGQGSLDLNGELSVSDGVALGRMDLTGTDFLAANLPEARVIMSPRLALAIDGRALRLEGDVRVPEARIAPRDLSGAIKRSPDEQVMREDGAPVSGGWLLGSRVRFEFGDKVTFDGFGLEARVTGAVTAVDEPGRVTTATGELQIVDGVYVAYGRQLEVRRGRLLFSGGPLDNPGLDILALRKIAGGPEVGVIARATLSEPELTLYAAPSMQSAQTLSYLLVGQPLADIEGVDRQLVNDTATRLATAGGGLLAQQLGRRFGLGDVSVASGPTGEAASLVIGKYLSPRLYASYGIGLFEPVNTLRLRYALSSKWNLRAESGLDQSVDLEYSLER